MSDRLAADLRETIPAPIGKASEDSPVADPASAGTGPVPGAESQFRLRPVPILIAIILGYGLPILSNLSIDFASDHIRLPSVHGAALPFNFLQHGILLVLTLITISVIRRRVPAEFGLHRPRGASYALPALYWGLAFGVLMTLVDFAPSIFTQTAPKFDDPLTTRNIAGWLVYMGLYAGPIEEVLYRSLLVGYLTAAMPGRVRFGGVSMNGAGVVVAVILAFGEITNFIALPFVIAFAQFLYTLAFGVLLAYWFEKSKSVVAPIVAHSVNGFARYVLLFSLIGIWS